MLNFFFKEFWLSEIYELGLGAPKIVGFTCLEDKLELVLLV